MYTANTGFVMTQGPSGVPMAMPMQAHGGMIAVQATTTGTQEGQPQMVPVPVSGAMGNLHVYAPQAAPHGAISYQPQQVHMPPAHGQGQYVTMENEQVLLELPEGFEGVNKGTVIGLFFRGKVGFRSAQTGIWSLGMRQKMAKMEKG